MLAITSAPYWNPIPAAPTSPPDIVYGPICVTLFIVLTFGLGSLIVEFIRVLQRCGHSKVIKQFLTANQLSRRNLLRLRRPGLF